LYRYHRVSDERKAADMQIVKPTDEDLSLADATRLTGYGAEKTLRRAVRAGELPRRYIMTARGPALVFRRADVERWSAQRRQGRRQRAAVPTPVPTMTHSAVLDAVCRMNETLTSSRTAIAGMLRQLEQHEQQLGSARATIDRLRAQLAHADAPARQDGSEATDNETAMTAMASGCGR
jgi:hypothetical protein